MNLNYNSFFVRKFLQCREYDCPNTVCDLAKRVVVWSIIWSILALMIGMITFAYFHGLVAVMLVMFTDTTWTTLSDKYEAGAVLFFTLNSAILLVVAWFSGIAAANYTSRKFHLNNTFSKPIPAIEFAKGIWERIHDKTCRVIEYENHPEERRRAEREKYFESLKVSQEYSRIDSEVTRIESEIAASQVADNSIK